MVEPLFSTMFIMFDDYSKVDDFPAHPYSVGPTNVM